MALTNRKTTIAQLVGLLISSNALLTYAADTANSNIVAISTELQTDEVVVTASRTPQSLKNVIADVSVIDSDEIERAGQSTFIELLQTQPGVEISSTGGQGTSSSVFLRGTNASQVVVLVDGLRVGSATLGTTSFENIPLAQIEKIEILRGPAANLYGQDAVGGVIQIFTKKSDGAPQFHAAVGYGSYDTKTAEAGVSGKANDIQFALNVSSSDTDSFSAKNIKTGAQADKDGYRNLAASGYLAYTIAQGHEFGVQVFSSNSHANYDSSDTFNNYVNSSQLAYSFFSKNQITSIWHSTLSAGEGIDDSNNQYDVGFGGSFKTKQRQYSWQNDVTLPLGRLTLAYDRLEQRVISDTLYDKTSRNSNGYLIGYLANIADHTLQANLRSDHSSQFGTNNTVSLAYAYSLTQNWRASASFGTAFKAPTFNDLYYPSDAFGVYSDPNLKAERSRNIEAGIHYEAINTSASATLYKNKINNFIALDPNYFPININAKIKGLTLAASQKWDSWTLKGSTDFQSPHDETNDTTLAHRANRHASANLSYSWQDWRFVTELVASSLRYNDAGNTVKLNGYALLNLVADYKINNDWKIQGRVNNLLDKDYALVSTATATSPNAAVYNTPGANLFVSLRWEPSGK
ncbi:MAG: TonB-dependent receptor [Methylophilaceae bacterium]|nr:TonB-dependent receptor [Methylophilaceae bacterium]